MVPTKNHLMTSQAATTLLPDSEMELPSENAAGAERSYRTSNIWGKTPVRLL